MENDNSNSYNLRNRDVFVLSSSTKCMQEQENNLFCPRVVKSSRKSFTLPRRRETAVPLGNKGKLSRNYNKNANQTYISQLFYEVENIGTGSFGVVHKYRSLEDGNYYAIKMIKHYDSHDRYGEIKRLDLVSDNSYCIQYLNAWEEDNVIYIQFELGIMSLADYAMKNHNICEEECWDVLYDVLNALVPLHQKELCHMDIKLDNIMVTQDGKYKLCDFGLLTDLNNYVFNSILEPEGDAKYIASEVLQGHISKAGDIFALGISIMELSTDLFLPIYGPSWHNLRQCSWRKLPETSKGRISFDLELVINWMMNYNANARPTAEQLLKTSQMVKRNRAKKPRFNYFADWLQKNECETNIPTVNITTPPESPSDGYCTPTCELSLSPVTTPVHRVSSVKLRRTFKRSLNNMCPSSPSA